MQKKPQPLAPPEGSKASVYTEVQHTPNVVREPASSPHSHTTRHVITPATQPHILVQKKSPLNLKVIAGAIASVVVIGLVTWVFLVQSERRRQASLYKEMVSYAANSGANTLPVTSEKLEILLKSAIAPNQAAARSSVFKALSIATASDTTDVDQRIAVFATTGEMSPEVRDGLFREVLLKRGQPTAVPYLLDFLNAKAQEPSSVAAALQLIRSLSGVEQIDPLLNALVRTGNDEVRKAVTETLDGTIRNAPNRTVLAARIATLNAESTHDATRFALIRLLGRCGGSTAEEIVKSLLNSPDPINQNAALIALESWSDVSVINLLTQFISQTDKTNIRIRAFDAAIRLLANTAASDEASSLSEHWKNLSDVAKTNDEQSKVIHGLANSPEDWAGEIILGYKNSDDASIAELAASALEEINDLRKIKGYSPIKDAVASADSPSDSASTTEILTPSDEDTSAASNEIATPSLMIQAEKFISTDGVSPEPGEDLGGSEQLSSIDPGDSTTYRIQVPSDGTYNAAFRISTIRGGTIRMYANDSQTSCGQIKIPDNTVAPEWNTYKTQINLPAGVCKLILKYEGKNGPMFNINWFALYQGKSMQSPTSFATLGATSHAVSENINATAEILEGNVIQAEKYIASTGIMLEPCNDVGGGKQVAFIENGDTTTHKIQVPKAGVYSMSFRVQPLDGGAIRMYANNSKTSCGILDIPSQIDIGPSWVTLETQANLPDGPVSLRLEYEGSRKYICNLNYFTIK